MQNNLLVRMQVPVAFYQEAPQKLFDINSLQDFGLQ